MRALGLIPIVWRALRPPRRAAAAPVGPVAVPVGAPRQQVSHSDMEWTIALVELGCGLPASWVRSATSSDLRWAATAIALEQRVRELRWALVEAGSWPAERVSTPVPTPVVKEP